MAHVDHIDWSEQMERWAKQVKASAAAAQEKMVIAGGDAAVNAMKTTSAWSDRTGKLRKGIKRSKVYRSGGRVFVEVFPSGKSQDGERLETIGFVLEYGRTGRVVDKVLKSGPRAGKRVRYTIHPMSPRPWMRPVVEDASGEIEAAMRKVWNAEMEKAK